MLKQRITPCLWFDHQAEEAARYYVEIFPNSRITAVTRYGTAGQEGHGRPPGSVMTVEFRLEGQDYVALNGGPQFKFTEAISLVVNCKDQKEIDYYWDKLLQDGGKEVACGWLRDRFGLSWQVTPAAWNKLYHSKDKAKVQRVFTAMMGMVKMDIAALERAARGK